MNKVFLTERQKKILCLFCWKNIPWSRDQSYGLCLGYPASFSALSSSYCRQLVSIWKKRIDSNDIQFYTTIYYNKVWTPLLSFFIDLLVAWNCSTNNCRGEHQAVLLGVLGLGGAAGGENITHRYLVSGAGVAGVQERDQELHGGGVRADHLTLARYCVIINISGNWTDFLNFWIL